MGDAYAYDPNLLSPGEDAYSQYALTGNEPEDSGDFFGFGVCLSCLLYFLIIGLIFFLLSLATKSEDDGGRGRGGGGGFTEAAGTPLPVIIGSGGGEGSGGGDGSDGVIVPPVTRNPPVPVPRPSPSEPRITQTVATPPQPVSTLPPSTQTQPTSVREVLCTVGHTAIASNMYPPEDICQYLYYTDVVIVEGKLRASLERNSWKLFQMKAMAYKKVKCGVAFDHWHITAHLVHDATGELGRLANQNIASYGLLNVIRTPSELQKVLIAMRPVLEALKTIQGGDADKRTVIAIGSYDYSGTGFMDKYKDIFANVINNAVAQVLRMRGVDYNTYDVPQDEAPRQWIKDFSNWPIIPQVYIGVHFVGGCTIVLQMHESGELVVELTKVAPRELRRHIPLPPMEKQEKR
ncbi:hypothetical protein HPB52_013701 [Rhipicephalus sanguineus]|uniref:Glutaredoxin domain-containing protein n=1 Tax=Rhipicephalus sanguineus TaxID=34632 RepID=A0A9D4PWF1_RHISA|nr:hypothetical protein HPB52_013701 [Rhipicephalus sanguineus]